MGNTSIVCREISPVPQELLHTSSQAPKGPIDGVCDEVCSSSASRKKCVAGRRRAQKVLPMSMRIVLPMSMRRAVRGNEANSNPRRIFNDLNGPEQIAGSFTLVSHLSFPFSYAPDVLSFATPHQGRYVRLAIDSAHIQSTGDTDGP